MPATILYFHHQNSLSNFFYYSTLKCFLLLNDFDEHCCSVDHIDNKITWIRLQLYSNNFTLCSLIPLEVDYKMHSVTVGQKPCISHL